jgi:2-aminoadipate transaminase
VATSRFQLARWARGAERSAFQEMLELTSRPGLTSLALGLPAEELFPGAALAASVAEVIATDERALQYEMPIERLKAQVVQLMEQRGVRCAPGRVFLTAGAQQGMSLLARILVEPGDEVVLEDRSYGGFQQVLAPLGVTARVVPSSPRTGLDLGRLEEALGSGRRPRLMYTQSDGHNPLGLSLSLAARQEVAALVRRYEVPLLEDDAYGFLFHGASSVPPVRAFEADFVCYIGSFSKLLAPGVRTGWLVVPEELCRPLAILKEASDVNTATLAQRAVSRFLAAGHLDAHVARVRTEYTRRRDAMLAALARHMPDGARWETPSSGMFVWVQLPPPIDSSRLLRRAVEQESVTFMPGHAFTVARAPGQADGMRLCFSHCPADAVDGAVERLGRAVRAELDASAQPRGRACS